MTLREMYEGKDLLLARRGLTIEETYERLSKLYSVNEVDNIILSAKAVEVWTDSELKVAVIYMKHSNKFIIIATGKTYGLVG